MSVKKNVKARRKVADQSAKIATPSIAENLLRVEIKCATNSLNESCGWAVNLSELVSGFDDSFVRTQQKLRELRKELARRKFDDVQQRKVRKVLFEIRRYSRSMADESKPLRVDVIIEQAQRMFDLEKLVTKLASLCSA